MRTRSPKYAASIRCRSSKLQTRARICDCGLYAAHARNAPALVRTATVSPACTLPSIRSTAPENTHGWHLRSDFSRPAFRTRAGASSPRRAIAALDRGAGAALAEARERAADRVDEDRGTREIVAEHFAHREIGGRERPGVRSLVARNRRQAGGERIADLEPPSLLVDRRTRSASSRRRRARRARTERRRPAVPARCRAGAAAASATRRSRSARSDASVPGWRTARGARLRSGRRRRPAAA